MQPDDRDDKGTAGGGRPRGDTAGTDSAPQTREEEAHLPRSGRPMPEEDAADRTEHHKGSYGGERGKPRETPETPADGDDQVK